MLLDLGEGAVDRRPRRRDDRRRPVADPRLGAQPVLAGAEDVGRLGERVAAPQGGDAVDGDDGLAPGGVGAADRLHDVLVERGPGQHAPAAVAGEVGGEVLVDRRDGLGEAGQVGVELQHPRDPRGGGAAPGVGQGRRGGHGHAPVGVPHLQGDGPVAVGLGTAQHGRLRRPSRRAPSGTSRGSRPPPGAGTAPGRTGSARRSADQRSGRYFSSSYGVTWTR